MRLRKLLPLAIVVGVAVVWAVGEWTGGHVPGQQKVPGGGGQSARAQSAGHDESERSQLGYVRIDEAEPDAVDPADAPSANVTNRPEGHATKQENLAPNEAASSAREPKPVSEASDRDRDMAGEPSDDRATLSISGWVQNDVGEPVAGKPTM